MESVELVDRLGAALVPQYAEQPLHVTIREIEAICAARHVALAELLGKPDATGASVTSGFLAEHASRAPPSTDGTGTAAPSHAAGGGFDPNDPVGKVLWSAAFGEIARQIEARPLESHADKLEVVTLCFDGRVPLLGRLVLHPDRALAKRHKVFAIACDLHRYAAAYFTRLLTSDANGDPMARMRAYHITGPPGGDGKPTPEGAKFFAALARLDFADMDWLFSPGGVLAYMALRDQCKALASIDLRDIYTTPRLVKEMGAFIHDVVRGLGGADTTADPAADGLTFKAWTARFLVHLDLVLPLPSQKEQGLFLDHCHTLWIVGLQLMSDRLHDIFTSQRPAEQTLEGGFFREDEEPMRSLLRCEAQQTKLVDLRSEWEGISFR